VIIIVIEVGIMVKLIKKILGFSSNAESIDEELAKMSMSQRS
jgi:hypothetical protein